jgi:hypothetical protein
MGLFGDIQLAEMNDIVNLEVRMVDRILDESARPVASMTPSRTLRFANMPTGKYDWKYEAVGQDPVYSRNFNTSEVAQFLRNNPAIVELATIYASPATDARRVA